MKNYRQLIRELPSKTVVMAVGSFNPPTAVNEMTFKLVKKLVESHNAEHVIFITENKNDLPVDRKIHFLNLMFNGLNFVPLTEGNLAEEIGGLKSRYKNVVVVTSEEKSKLFESMSVVSAPVDSNASKIKSFVTKGDYTSFKAAMPSSLRDIDARRLMNEMRQSYGLELLKEDVRFSIDSLRDKYFKGEIYQIGDIVESAGSQYEIMDRGSNYLVVVDNKGDLHRKWVKDVSLVETVKKPTGPLKKACWKGYTAVGLKKKNGRTVPNCVPESVLNPMNVHKDYESKRKALHDLSLNKDVDQKHVQQRRLDLDKEYSKYKKESINESTTIEHNSNHKVIKHGEHFSFRVGKEHHDKIHNLNHKEQHTFKCLDGLEWGVHRDGEKLHFQGHPGDTGIHGNMTVVIPHAHFMNEDETQVSYKGYTTKNMHHDPEMVNSFRLSAADAKDPVAMLNAIKTTDTYLELHNERGDNPSLEQLKTWKYAHIKAYDALQKIGKFYSHQDSWIKSGEELDKMLAPHGLKEGIEIGKHSNANLERSYMTYRDFMKANKIEPGFVKDTKYGPFTQEIDPNVSQQIDDLEPFWPRHPHTKVGSTLANRDHHRRQKVAYHLESFQHIDEDAKSLKAQADKHTEHAVATNRAGDDEKVKYHQAQVAKIKAKLSKLSEEQINEISQKLAGNYLDKVTKQNLAKHGMQPNMYEKLPKNRQKGVANAFKRLEVDKEGKPVHHLVSKEDYIKGDLMDEEFASKFYEANGGEIGDEIGDDKIKKVKTLPLNIVKNDSKRLGGGTRDHTFSAFMEKQKMKTKENVSYDFRDLMKHQQTGE